MAKVILIKAFLINILLVFAVNCIAQDITYLTGSGNFTNGETTDEEIHQINALNFYGAKNGYATAIVDLINNGKLAGFDLHTYNDNTYAPIVDNQNEFYWRYCAQADFNEIQEEIGITRPIKFYATEFSYKANILGISEEESAKRQFTCI